MASTLRVELIADGLTVICEGEVTKGVGVVRCGFHDLDTVQDAMMGAIQSISIRNLSGERLRRVVAPISSDVVATDLDPRRFVGHRRAGDGKQSQEGD
jgi:hypothetical protein